MAETALTLYVIFMLVALVGRTLLQYQRTGDHGIRMPSAAFGSVEWLAGLLFVSGGVLAGVAPLLALLGVLEPVGAIDMPLVRWAGGGLGLGGFALVLAAQVQMGASWRVGVDPGETTALVQRGLFLVVRNPIFTGMLLACFGLACMVPNGVALLAAGLLLVGLELQVRVVEEPYLTRVHGERYLEYARRVGRFLPGLGRLR